MSIELDPETYHKMRRASFTNAVVGWAIGFIVGVVAGKVFL